MAAILSYGAALPSLRLSADEYKQAWGACNARGMKQKAFCAYDQDAVTLGIEAARAAFARLGETGDVPAISALFFGVTSPPYDEKPSAATLVTALLGSSDLRVTEITGSPQAGLQALLSALEYCTANPGKTALAIAADAPSASPDASFEHALGAAGAAFIVGDGTGVAPIATLVASAGVSTETFGARHRRHGEDSLSDLELRTRDNQASLKSVSGLIDGASAKHLAMGADGGLMRSAPKTLGCDDAAADSLWTIIGDPGSAAAPFALAAALDEAGADELILSVAVGGGATAAVFAATDGLAGLRVSGDTIQALTEKGESVNYMSYLKHRRVLSSRFGGGG